MRGFLNWMSRALGLADRSSEFVRHRGEADLDGQAPAQPGLRGDLGAVRRRYGINDRQAQAMVAVVANVTSVEPKEGLEQAGYRLRRDGRSGVGHRQDRAAVPGRCADHELSFGDVVPQGV